MESGAGWMLTFAALMVACGGRSSAEPLDDDVPRCIPGAQVACDCFGGEQGVQSCKDDGTFSPCICGPSGAGGRGVGGSIASGGSGGGVGGSGANGGGVGATGGSSGGATGGNGAQSPGSGGGAGTVDPGDPGSVIATGEATKLVDVFVGNLGYYIVRGDALVLVDRSGEVITEVTVPRPVTAAAFDGERLVIADGAKLTGFDLELDELGSGELVEGCASAVLVSGGRFVCGPENDWDRVFYTYDVESFELIASSKPYTYNGIFMRRVSGTDDFVTVSDGSPSDFHLYSVVESGEVMFVNESPYHGDFVANEVFAFDPVPATHLVNATGLMLHIYGEGCTVGSPHNAQCFVKDGALGTNTGGQVFIGLENDDQGKMYGLINPGGSPYPSGSGLCKDKGCIAQRIDVASRTVEAQRIIHAEVSAVVALRHDLASSAIVLGHYVGLRSGPFGEPSYPGFQVTRIELP